ncbi:MAG: hypothetical protein IJ775_02840 [Muribaculaceae bacterium]|nr:hypothetical protein [Muribaculaceae bacterium]
MNIRIHFTLVMAATAAMALAQNSTDSTTLARIERENANVATLLQLAWNNPAVAQWQRPFSLSEVALSNHWRSESQPIESQLGDHALTWAFDADTYMKHRSSTLWGHATYNNGKTDGIRWNETSDVDVVYPYLMADSVTSAAMKTEIYSFAGGYADHRNRWHWGGEISYRAGLHYRNVDPRPRNVTARLHITAGSGIQVTTRYMAALAIGYEKYKQTNEVAFYSELGHDKIYHLTGLTNDYGRFAGAGDDTYYRGHKWTASLNWHPIDNRGFSAAVQFSQFTFDKVLKSLNKLPMTAVTHRQVRAEMGWLAQQWAVRAWLDASRRVGHKNIFGDPAASVYPQIASLDMYHDNRFATGADARWTHQWSHTALTVMPAVGYRHHNTIYADPQSRWLVNEVTAAMRLQGSYRTGRTFSTLTVGGAWTDPTRSELMLTGTKSELAGLQRAIEHDFALTEHHHISWEAAACVDVAINHRFALRARIQWLYSRYTLGITAHQLHSSLALLF